MEHPERTQEEGIVNPRPVIEIKRQTGRLHTPHLTGLARAAMLVVSCALSLALAQDAPPARQVLETTFELLARYYHGYTTLNLEALRAEFTPKLEAACQAVPDPCGLEVAEAVVDEMISSLNDPHTYFLNRTQTLEAARAFSGEPSEGFRLGANISSLGGSLPRLVVRRAFAGGPAFEGGLRRGDLIRSFNGLAVESFPSTSAALSALATAARDGQAVRLEVERAYRQRFSLEIKPRHLLPPPPELELRPDGVAVITIFQFQDADRVAEAVHDDVRQAALAGAHAIVLDVRDNSGGWGSAMMRVLGAFVDFASLSMEAASARFQARYELLNTTLTLAGVGDITEMAVARNPALWTGPLVVLTSARTASAAEYLAFMLQRSGRARVVGEPTAGLLATGTAPFDLPGGSSLWVTVVRSIAEDGTRFPDRVTPDRLVRYNPTALTFGHDLALEYAVARLK
jgi:carboxyl-terminal processing protease